ncbi:hypothetical protein CEXT_784331 [Caerostris extrusa]|uniref:Uncharacterized protein n=1 Tax=Caerostris extrusa TaxID=172846 RepID=A0AAV4R2G3_CAEEX|nr:hypothetical protein CEXT_784331 [Caerostris extrusa]
MLLNIQLVRRVGKMLSLSKKEDAIILFASTDSSKSIAFHFLPPRYDSVSHFVARAESDILSKEAMRPGNWYSKFLSFSCSAGRKTVAFCYIPGLGLARKIQ